MTRWRVLVTAAVFLPIVGPAGVLRRGRLLRTELLLRAGELRTPDAVYCVGVSHRECVAVMSLIARNPISFGPEQWLSREQIGDDVPNMLPKGAAALDTRAIAELEEWLGRLENFQP